MSVSSSALKSKMLTATKDKTVAATVMSDLGKAIADYLNANNKVDFSWLATDPLGVPDSAVTCTGIISGITIALTPSMTDKKSVAQLKLSTEIKAGVALGTYTTDGGFVCGTGAVSSAPTLATLNLDITGPERDDAYGQMADQVVDWFTSLIPTIPVSGSHGKYSGAATPTAIS